MTRHPSSLDSSANRLTLFVTIDTEADADPHWNKHLPFRFRSITEGIPQLLRPLWDAYQVIPIYFVSPEVLQDDACCQVLRKEIRKGCIIGAHLHPEYIAPKYKHLGGKPTADFPCYANSTEIEYQKLQNLVRLCEERLSLKPEWYRAGRFGADFETMQSLRRLGFIYDSSVTPHIDWTSVGGPDHSQAPEQPYWISKQNYYAPSKQADSLGILEVPVTIGTKRFGPLGHVLPDHWAFHYWIRPTHMTVFEHKRVIRTFMQTYTAPTLVMMFHVMEILVNTSPYVRNSLMQKLFLKRIEKTLAFVHSLDKRACGDNVRRFLDDPPSLLSNWDVP